MQTGQANIHQDPAIRRKSIVVGAAGGIGHAMFQHWANHDAIDQVIGISRLQYPSINPVDTEQWVQSDYSEESIAQICQDMAEEPGLIKRVCICNGILHNEKVWPDKRIEDIEPDSMHELFRINTVLPMIWLKHLLPLLRGKHHCSVSVFSARIGSIADNRSGGWYGYRASKAALNMMLKTANIEFARRAKNVKLIAFHPGTTDTNLSRPFLKNVKHEILQPETVACSLGRIMDEYKADGELSFLDWENQPIEW